jgi:HPr kinase/phosphorylase
LNENKFNTLKIEQMAIYRVDDLFKKHDKALGLQLVAGKKGLSRAIRVPEAQRPGLSLSGYLKGYVAKRILVFGKSEMEFLKDLHNEERTKRIGSILTKHTPAVIIARRMRPSRELIQQCDKKSIPLFRTDMQTMNFLSKLTLVLAEEFAPSNTCHGTLVEVFGVGVLIQGSSSVGKSETALGLIERGHRLVADDVVKVSMREGSYLEGAGTVLTRHLMEIRGIGIINVAHLYGALCVRESKSIDIVVYLEAWDDQHSYERVGLEEKSCDILGCAIPFYVLPVKPGRDVVLLLETIALNHRLKQMGLNSAKEFSTKLHETIASKKKRKGRIS